tara:strand:+ start:629 stop:826 length:198 start_codon:yes stop_codon:yes gene_type:complete
MILYFALSMSEMGLSPLIISIISISSILFITGFIKSSKENEYRKLMDSFVNSEPDEEEIGESNES